MVFLIMMETALLGVGGGGGDGDGAELAVLDDDDLVLGGGSLCVIEGFLVDDGGADEGVLCLLNEATTDVLNVDRS
jgi:hypothetical protein